MYHSLTYPLLIDFWAISSLAVTISAMYGNILVCMLFHSFAYLSLGWNSRSKIAGSRNTHICNFAISYHSDNSLVGMQLRNR